MAPTNSAFPNFLRQIIKQRGMTVKEVAEDADIPERTLHDYCAGNVPIPKRRREALARVLECTADDLVPPFPGSSAPNLLQYEFEQANEQALSGAINPMDNLRRKILQQLLTSTNIVLVVPHQELLNLDAWERLALALKDPYRTDNATVTHLEHLTNTYWDLCLSAIARSDLLSSASGHLMNVTQLLRTSQPLSLQRRLCCLVSNTYQILGAIYFDMNKIVTAEAYQTLAIEAAHEVANDPLEALALGRLGILSIQRGAYSESLPILQRAYALAENTVTGKSKAWLTMKEAEAYSGLQSKDKCLSALDRTEEVSDQDGSSSTGEDRRWIGSQIGFTDGNVYGLQIWLKTYISRYFESTLLQELEWHLHTALFALVLGFGTIYNTHVRVDLVRDHVSFRKKIWIEFLGLSCFMIPYLLLVIWFASSWVVDSYNVGEISASTVGLSHRWIIKGVLVFGLIVATIAGVAVWLQVAVLMWGDHTKRFRLMTLEWPEEAGTKIEGKERIVLDETPGVQAPALVAASTTMKPAE